MSKKDFYAEKYGGRNYIYNCRKCRIKERDRKEFEFLYCQRIKGAILRCKNCGHMISKNIKALDKQIKKGKK